jgi:hypothetical protein
MAEEWAYNLIMDNEGWSCPWVILEFSSLIKWALIFFKSRVIMYSCIFMLRIALTIYNHECWHHSNDKNDRMERWSWFLYDIFIMLNQMIVQ